MVSRNIRLITETAPRRPTLDTAVSGALLRRVSEGAEPETLRLHRPPPILAFGPQDLREPGYPDAVAAGFDAGFTPVRRMAGGRAAVFHEGTIAFSWTIPDPNPRENIHARFRELAALMEHAFRNLGIDARVGEVAGEYCPGEYSVNARGAVKLMGVGQRLVGRAVHIGGVVVVDGAERVRDILLPVYHALGIAWDSATVGSLAEEVPGVSYEAAVEAILQAFGEQYSLTPGVFSPETLALAGDLEPDYTVGPPAHSQR